MPKGSITYKIRICGELPIELAALRNEELPVTRRQPFEKDNAGQQIDKSYKIDLRQTPERLTDWCMRAHYMKNLDRFSEDEAVFDARENGFFIPVQFAQLSFKRSKAAA
jgi:hypothetical protein